ncbi:unnamed protein product [Eretmochelys imbricata]
MEEVDKILIHSLRLSGTGRPPAVAAPWHRVPAHLGALSDDGSPAPPRQVPEEVQSLREFTTELIVESVVRCLRVIHPSLGASLGHVLPPGMSARFRIGTSLAQACQELGYQGEVGYQTFLYSNEPEIRRLLLFLVEKLPRDDAEDARQPAGKSAGLLRAIAAKIKEQLGTPWVPPACRTPRLQLLQGTCLLKPFHAHPLVLPRDSGPVERREFFGGFLPPVSAQPPRPGAVAPSLLERHAGDLGAQHDWEADWQSQGLASRLPPKEYVQWKHQRLRHRLLDQLRQAAPPHGAAGPPQPGPLDLAQMLGLLSAGGTGGALAKGSRFSRAQRLVHEQDPQELVGQMQAAVETLPSSKTSEQEELARQAEELAGLQGELRRLEAEMEAVGGEVKVLELSLSQAAAGLCQQRLALGGPRADPARTAPGAGAAAGGGEEPGRAAAAGGGQRPAPGAPGRPVGDAPGAARGSVSAPAGRPPLPPAGVDPAGRGDPGPARVWAERGRRGPAQGGAVSATADGAGGAPQGRVAGSLHPAHPGDRRQHPQAEGGDHQDPVRHPGPAEGDQRADGEAGPDLRRHRRAGLQGREAGRVGSEGL